VGNARVDLKVWEGTSSGMVVSNCEAFINSARQVTKIEKVFKKNFARLEQSRV
jgi:hypothetical protein